MPQQKPILLVLGGPPDRWFTQLGPAREEVEIRLTPRPEDLDSTLPEAEIVFTWEESDEWLRERWSQARKLKWVQSSSAGVELLLFPGLVESSVVVTNGQGLYAEALGEFVLFCVLSFAKDYRTMEDNRRARRWRNYNVVEARGQTIGIVGLGGTGRVIARMAKVFWHARNCHEANRRDGRGRWLRRRGRASGAVARAAWTVRFRCQHAAADAANHGHVQ